MNLILLTRIDCIRRFRNIWQRFPPARMRLIGRKSRISLHLILIGVQLLNAPNQPEGQLLPISRKPENFYTVLK